MNRAEPPVRDHRRSGVTDLYPTNNKHTMKKIQLFVGLDVHAKHSTLALAEGARKDSVHAAGGGGEARLFSRSEVALRYALVPAVALPSSCRASPK